MNLGKAIRTIRKKRGFNQCNFADSIGITQAYLSGIENCKKTPSVDLLEKIAEFTKTPLPVLFWFSVTYSDVDTDKRDGFKLLKPIMDKLLESVFLLNMHGVVNNERSEVAVCPDCKSEDTAVTGVNTMMCLNCGTHWTN